jgi:hypothetical protein
VLNKALDRINEDLLGGGNTHYEYEHYEHLRLAEMAHGGYVLARVGRAPVGTLRAMYDNERGSLLGPLPLVPPALVPPLAASPIPALAPVDPADPPDPGPVPGAAPPPPQATGRTTKPNRKKPQTLGALTTPQGNRPIANALPLREEISVEGRFQAGGRTRTSQRRGMRGDATANADQVIRLTGVLGLGTCERVSVVSPHRAIGCYARLLENAVLACAHHGFSAAGDRHIVQSDRHREVFATILTNQLADVRGFEIRDSDLHGSVELKHLVIGRVG